MLTKKNRALALNDVKRKLKAVYFSLIWPLLTSLGVGQFYHDKMLGLGVREEISRCLKH